MPMSTLNGFKLVISHSILLIGNDTGLTHMAWELNRPFITIFSPTLIERVFQTPINKTLKIKLYD